MSSLPERWIFCGDKELWLRPASAGRYAIMAHLHEFIGQADIAVGRRMPLQITTVNPKTDTIRIHENP